MKKIGLYEISIIIFFVLLPIVGSGFEVFILTLGIGIIGVMFKWFVFFRSRITLIYSRVKTGYKAFVYSKRNI